MIELKIMKRLMEIVPLLNVNNIGIIPGKCQGKSDSGLYRRPLKRYCHTGVSIIDCELMGCLKALREVSQRFNGIILALIFDKLVKSLIWMAKKKVHQLYKIGKARKS